MRAQDRLEHRNDSDLIDIHQYLSASIEDLMDLIDEGTDCVNCLDVPYELSNVPDLVE